MGMLDALREALARISDVDVRGERNIASMIRAISLLKAAVFALEEAKEEQHDDHDKQG